jgi:hypothetical protein
MIGVASMKAAGATMRHVPTWAWILLAVLLLGAWHGQARYAAGQADVQAKWDAAVERGKAEVARLEREAGQVTVRVETRVVERIKTLREKSHDRLAAVPTLVPAGSCELPGGWRVLHDSAASDGPVPAAAGAAVAAGVPAEAAAATVVGNYAACHETAARLTGLQAWVSEQCRLNPPKDGCP